MVRVRALAIACLLLLEAPLAFAQTKVAIGYTPNAEVATAYVAKEAGFFAKHGLDVELIPVAVNSTLPAAMLAGSLQIGTTAPTVFLQAVDGGLDLAAVSGVSVTSRSATGAAIAAGSATKIHGAKDLVGRKIGVPGINAVLHVMARRWLMTQGVDPNQVTFIEASFPNHSDVLKQGTVDAVVTVDPFLGRIIAAGVGYSVIDLNQDLPEGMTALLYATTSSWAKANPAAVKAFRESIEEAAQFVAKMPDETRSAIGVYLKLPPPVLKTIALPKVDPRITSQQLDWWVDVMNQQGMLRSKVDTKRLVVP